MFKVPGKWPHNAIRRLPRQAPRVHFPHSCQQELILEVTTDALLVAWEVSHPFASVIVQDVNKILPYTSLEFVFASTHQSVPQDAATVSCWSDTGDTALQARARFVQNINSWAAHFGVIYPDVRSLRAAAYPNLNDGFTYMTIFMPWGMAGSGTFTKSVPATMNVVAGANIGVDCPLAYTLIGKRRHITELRNAYADDYYGDYYREPPEGPS
jgi:hypothetical protein